MSRLSHLRAQWHLGRSKGNAPASASAVDPRMFVPSSVTILLLFWFIVPIFLTPYTFQSFSPPSPFRSVVSSFFVQTFSSSRTVFSSHRFKTLLRCHRRLTYTTIPVISQFILSITLIIRTAFQTLFPSPSCFCKRSAQSLSGAEGFTSNPSLVYHYSGFLSLLNVSGILHLRADWNPHYTFNTALRCYCQLRHTSIGPLSQIILSFKLINRCPRRALFVSKPCILRSAVIANTRLLWNQSKRSYRSIFRFSSSFLRFDLSGIICHWKYFFATLWNLPSRYCLVLLLPL